MWDTEVGASVSPTPMNSNFTEAVSADTTAQPAPVKRLKRGDVREDGMVFWEYGARAKNGEYWVTPEYFKDRRANTKVRSKAYNSNYRKVKKDFLRASKSAYYLRTKARWAEYNKRYREKNTLKTHYTA